MPLYSVRVKWGRQLHCVTELDSSRPPLAFKSRLFSLTGVRPERQRVVLLGTQLKDHSWGILKLRDGVTVLLVGTTDELPLVPPDRPLFAEDVSRAGHLPSALAPPVGLLNLGRSCYLSAVVQCLGSIPELRAALAGFTERRTERGGTEAAGTFTAALRDLFDSMARATVSVDTSSSSSSPSSRLAQELHRMMTRGDARGPYAALADSDDPADAVHPRSPAEGRPTPTLPPVALWKALHRAAPDFARTGHDGLHLQQDVAECWTRVLRLLRETLQVEDPAWADPEVWVDGDGKLNFVEQFFGVKVDKKKTQHSLENGKSRESGETRDNGETQNNGETAETQRRRETQGNKEVPEKGKTHEVKETTRKGESHHNGETQETGETRVSLIELRRATSDSGSTLDFSARLALAGVVRLPAYLGVHVTRTPGDDAHLQEAAFPLRVDALQLCSPALRERLGPGRRRLQEMERRRRKHGEQDSSWGSTASNDDDDDEDYDGSFDDDVGSNNSGCYDLRAVVSWTRPRWEEDGGGHYVSWLHWDAGHWWKCDDEIVTRVTSEEVLSLRAGRGGGGGDAACLLLYGPPGSASSGSSSPGSALPGSSSPGSSLPESASPGSSSPGSSSPGSASSGSGPPGSASLGSASPGSASSGSGSDSSLA
ncbi:ubiquitin carboxyl-terminal hydrolase 14-like [Lethenteron reissneri]|uniref:ubiquitin carboxyl-terminal hydrolase 14-like n=1 Tax=Lethenteron reissneri TaxID=7753 RepID=UPI002AB6B0FB|nr:ubiquitin carboxyl-terminal hydrolase 14-like [Lethenteron reissneri]